MIYIFLFFAFAGVGQSGSVDLFQPLSPRCFAQGANGTFYVLDSREHQVRHYSENLKLLHTFGARGEGPGEFLFADGIFYFEGIVYVDDAVFFTLFDATGKPLKKIRKPFDAEWYPTGKSWIAFKRYERDGKAELIWFSEDFARRSLLDVDQDTTFADNTFNPEGRPIKPAFSKSRQHLAKADKNRFLIRVFDAHRGTLQHVIEQEVKLRPVDRAWGEETATKMLAMMQAYGSLERKPSALRFPEYFPPIIRLAYTVDDHLITFGVLRPGRLQADFAFDPAGKRVDIQGNPEDFIFKVLMKHDGFAYLSLFEDEETVIRKVPLADLEQVLAETKTKPEQPDESAH